MFGEEIGSDLKEKKDSNFPNWFNALSQYNWF
jgi:hypothetical protein